MGSFWVQVNGTEPDGWFEVKAWCREEAAFNVAYDKCGYGTHQINVQVGNRRYVSYTIVVAPKGTRTRRGMVA